MTASDALAEPRDIARPGRRIVAITAGGPYPWIVINAIAERFGIVTVLEERPESRGAFLKRRARRVGWLSTAGQFATMTLSRFGKRFAAKRERELIAAHDLRTEPGPDVQRIEVSSANGADAVAALQSLQPDVVFLAGCRMLTATTLADIGCPVINYHAGITPLYRGMMGGYWALASDDGANFGTTVHLVDPGVDTGAVLYQARMTPDRRDTMLTYAMVMAAGSRDICIRAVEDALEGRLLPLATDLPSRQWFHPPIWTYLWNGLTKRVW